MKPGDPPRDLDRKTDEELVELCRHEDGHAWAALVERYKTMVYAIPVRFRLPAEDGADIFQAVWLDLYAELGRLREPAALRGWLVAAATHKCLHWKQREARRSAVALGREVEMDLSDERPLADQIGLEAERDQLLRDALREIPERCRRMMKMLFYERPSRPYADVAKQLGLAEGSIGFIRGRCLQKLRKALELLGY